MLDFLLWNYTLFSPLNYVLHFPLKYTLFSPLKLSFTLQKDTPCDDTQESSSDDKKHRKVPALQKYGEHVYIVDYIFSPDVVHIFVSHLMCSGNFSFACRKKQNKKKLNQLNQYDSQQDYGRKQAQ